MKSVTIIQARTMSSQDFPAKPCCRFEIIPVLSLAALRAANLGDEVRVATSTDSSG